MERTRKKTIQLRLYLAYCICALLVYVLLMAFVLPWWHVSNHPVVLTLGAGSAQKMGLSYSPDEEPLDLVPVGQTEGYHWKWATELPPRPEYDLELVFPEGTVGEVVFKQLELIRLSPGRESSFLRVNDLSQMENPGIQIKKLVDGIRIYAEAGGRLPLEVEAAAPTAYTWLQTWARSSFGYLVTAVILLFSLGTFVQFPDRIQAYRKNTPIWEVAMLVTFAVFGALVHLHLVHHSMPVFSPGKSDPFVLQAINIHNGAGLQVSESSMPQRPGYAYFISHAAADSGWDMSKVAFYQGILFSVAAMLAGLACVRFIHAWAIGPILILALVSPPAIWASRHIGVESLSITMWLFGLAAFLLQWQREKLEKWLGFVLFGGVVFIASCISSSGLLMLILPFGVMVGTVVWCAGMKGLTFWKLDVFWRSLAQAVLPVVMLILAGFYLNLTQPDRWNLFSLPTDPSAATFASGMFEMRAIEDPDQYTTVINQRLRSGYRLNWTALADTHALKEKSGDLLPMRAHWVAYGRLAFWGLFLPDVETASGNKLLKDYTVRNNFASSAEAKGVQDSIASIMRATREAVFVKEKRSNRQVVVYNQTIVDIYKWFYRILFFVALAGWLIGLSDRKHLAGLFILPYMANIIVHVFTYNSGSELIQSMDALLWIGALAGLLGVSARALQKPTDETDRRTIKPFRPTRLLTRQPTIPGLKNNWPHALRIRSIASSTFSRELNALRRK